MAETMWKSEEVCAATGGVLRGQPFTASGVSIDTRTLKAGDVFFALSGDNFDGHDYLSQARQSGAVAAVVSRMPAGVPKDLPMVVVPDTQIALQDLGRAARRRSQADIIGVTGSVGKTSAKEMLKLALGAYGEVFATAGNYNNHIGLPLMLANMPLDTDFGIFEMGMNHAGEIEFLSRMAEPHVSLITAVEAVHLEFFDSVAEIAKAKGEIFSGMQPGGMAVLDIDSPHFPLLLQLAESNALEVLTFGESQDADFWVQDAECGMQGTEVKYGAYENRRMFRLRSLASHWPKLAVAVLAVVEALELPLEKAEKALAEFSEQPGRGQLLLLPWQGGTVTIIDDSYNASPVSMRGALEKIGTLKPSGNGRRIAVLGEMLELGKESARYHAELAPVAAAQELDAIFLAGEGMRPLHAALPASLQGGLKQEAEALEPVLIETVRAGDIILFKGSHGSKVYRLVTAFKRYSEQQGERLKAHAV